MDLAGSWPAGNACPLPWAVWSRRGKARNWAGGFTPPYQCKCTCRFGGEIQADLESVIDPDNEGDSVVTGRSEKLDHELAGFAEIGPDGRESGSSGR
jgi:hypothetical protein